MSVSVSSPLDSSFGRSIYNNAGAPASVGLGSDGAVPISSASGLATYTAFFTAFTPVAAPTDIIQLIGSATKTVTVTRIELSIISDSAVATAIEARVAKRSALSVTAATLNAVTGISHRTNTPAGVAIAAATGVAGYISGANWTTLGTLVGYVGGKFIMPQLKTYTATNFPSGKDALWTFGDHNEMPLTLISATEVVAINLNGVTLTGTVSVCASITWTEQATTY